MALSTCRRVPATFLSKFPLITSIKVARISDYEKTLIGKREIVGYGFNGQPSYVDTTMFPFPSIRWKETTPEILALREKEKGDWKQLTCEEKKALYRASFRQTFPEFKSNTGEWKSIIGSICILMSCGIGLFYLIQQFVLCQVDLPESFSEENRAAQFRRILDLQMNPVEGLASRWDYEKDDWKNPNDPWRSKKKTKKAKEEEEEEED
ncbi:hypothetical protein ABEB36_001376 [Hypothenemus hampei]|uniref:Cytochrome c oxidase subunit 4 n=1 Tax=Hypothenemus hampei TaxID=57062 RepID=A0ABD1FHX1_HYPHA